MTKTDQKQLGKILWNIADDRRGAVNADDFRDYKRGLMQQLLPPAGGSRVIIASPREYQAQQVSV